MEYRKNMRTPLDRVDEVFLQKMLEENAAEERYGEICSEHSARQHSYSHSGCESIKNNRSTGSRQSIHDDHAHSFGCGCSSRNPGRASDQDNHSNHFGCGCSLSGRNRRSDEGEHSNMSGCGYGNGRTNAVREGYPLAMLYSPAQEWRELLEAEEALTTGTLFRELVFPWYPAACRGENNCGCQGVER